jgi:hypothetical protein
VNTAPQTKPDGSVWDFPQPVEVFGVVWIHQSGKMTMWTDTFPDRVEASREVQIALALGNRKARPQIIPVRIQPLQRVMVRPSPSGGAS